MEAAKRQVVSAAELRGEEEKRDAGGEEKVGQGGKDEVEPKRKREVDSAVFNLGVTGLTVNMEKLLSLGLKFVPVQKVNRSKVEADVERLRV